MKVIKKIRNKIITYGAKKNSSNYIRFLRRVGVEIGEGTIFYSPNTTYVDISRPHLVTIGRDVKITRGVSILTHGADWHVLRNRYKDPFICGSSGKVVIENNVFIGINSVILKGCTIGRDSIIGAGSIVTKSIPCESVAVGNPARVLMDLETYYQKRKAEALNEAKENAYEFWQRFHRKPEPKDFKEFFPYFLERKKDAFGQLPVYSQMGEIFDDFMRTKPVFESFEQFLEDSGVDVSDHND